jgi:acetolactate synthase-1/3 small subunit
MLTPVFESQPLIQFRSRSTVLELTVNNQPGVMIRVCSLFSRRAFNVEGILCMPIDSGGESRIWLLVNQDRQDREDQRLEQMIKQLLKLEDVLDVQRHNADHKVFVQLEQFFRPDRQETHLLDDKQGLRFV